MTETDPVKRLIDGQVWDDFCDRLKKTGHEVLAVAPMDSLDRAESSERTMRGARPPGRRRGQRWLLGVSGAWLLALASPAAGGGPTCVTGCVDKTDACAVIVHELTGMDPRASQLGCAHALFVDCVARCQESNVIVWDDYQVAVPGKPGVGPPPPEQGAPASGRNPGYVARR